MRSLQRKREKRAERRARHAFSVNDKDYMVVPHRAISDDSKQNWFHTCGELELSLEALKQEFPTINEVHMLSDGASNYDCTATLLALGEISARTNVKVRDNSCLKCHYYSQEKNKKIW